MCPSTDRIKREILIIHQVRPFGSILNAEEFGDWFGVVPRGKLFEVGFHVQGQITYSGYEHLVFDLIIERMEPERLFSGAWHPAQLIPSAVSLESVS